MGCAHQIVNLNEELPFPSMDHGVIQSTHTEQEPHRIIT